MRKAQSRIKKKKIARRAPRPVENPAWLREDPVGNAISLPVRTRPSLLPFHELTPEDFERLCLREHGRNLDAIHNGSQLPKQAGRGLGAGGCEFRRLHGEKLSG